MRKLAKNKIPKNGREKKLKEEARKTESVRDHGNYRRIWILFKNPTASACYLLGQKEAGVAKQMKKDDQKQEDILVKAEVIAK